MKIRLGTAPVSWGIWFANDPKQIPWNRFLDEVVEAGYSQIELGPLGYLPSNLLKLKSELGRRNLSTSGTFVMRHLEEFSKTVELEKEVISAGATLAELGAKFLILIDDTYSDVFTGTQLTASRLDKTAWKKLIGAAHGVASLISKRFGLKLVFHPHTETHVEYEDQIEEFLEQTDPEKVSLCLDTGHHIYRGGDPIEFTRRHHDRIPYLHLKNVNKEVHEIATAQKMPFAQAVAMDVFCEPDRGALDFLAFRDMLNEIGFDGWATVEQDMYPAPFDKPLPVAKATRDYLRSIGFGGPTTDRQ